MTLNFLSIIRIPNVRATLWGKGIGATLARGALGSFGIKIAGGGTAFGLQVLLARLMGIDQYGIYIYALTWINLLAMIAILGFDSILVRFVSTYRAQEEWNLLRGVLQRSLVIVFLAGILLSSVGAIIIWLFREKLAPEQAETLCVALLLLPVLAISNLRSAALRAFRSVVKAELPDILLRPLLVASLVLFAYYGMSVPVIQASWAMAMNFIATLGAFGLGSFWLVRALPTPIRHANPRYLQSEWLKVSLPLFMISGMYLVLNQTDIIMLGAMQGTAQAGIYAAAARVASLVAFGLAAVNAIAAPLISELYHTGRRRELQSLMTLAARGSFGVTLILGLSLAVLGERIMALFGKPFVLGYIPLLVLLTGQLINALSGSVGLLMTMTGRQNHAAIIVGGSALVNIALNAVLIPPFGLMGAATATALTMALWNLAMLGYVVRSLGIKPTIL